MLRVINKEDKEKWNEEIAHYDSSDVYYLYDYAKSLMLHGDGEPFLICYSDEECRICFSVLKSDISKCSRFAGILPEGRYYDIETPYGYGGPLIQGCFGDASAAKFELELKEYCITEGIVSLFVRFDGLVSPVSELEKVFEIRYLRETIFIDTSDQCMIMQNMDSKCRNMVRKAEKSGIEIIKKNISEYNDFMPIYHETMKNNDADEYYLFREEYFKALSELHENACIYYAYYDNKAVSAAVMLFNSDFMQYHLSGTLAEYRKFSPGNLLLYKAACDASELGIKKFHLGGGMSEDDSLFGFKKQFNKKGRMPFYVGRMIFDKQKYDELLNLRKQNDSEFDINNNFMIQYRR